MVVKNEKTDEDQSGESRYYAACGEGRARTSYLGCFIMVLVEDIFQKLEWYAWEWEREEENPVSRKEKSGNSQVRCRPLATLPGRN
jgi:hypothetical protein